MIHPIILSMSDYSRSTTREQWQRIWSERRSTKRTERQIVRRQSNILATVPDIPERIRADILDKISNPVLFAWPSL